jgi:hypothetical protein
MNMMNRPPFPRTTTGAAPTRPGASAPGRPAAVPPAALKGISPNATMRPPPQAPAPMSAKTAGAKADDMFMVMRQLCDLLTKENAALKRYRVEEVKSMTERKEQLAALYHTHMNALQRDPAAMKGLDTAKRTALMQLAARLAELMRDNASMLKANIRSIDTFFQSVTDAVRDREEKKSASYSRAGVLNGYATVKRNLAVSYNRTT